MYDELKFEDCKHSRDPILGCALEGVANIIAGIKNSSIIIHSPQGCSATVAAAYDNHEIDFTRRKIGCTRLFESDIIMGASEKLKSMIKEADETFNTQTMFVVGTCAADIIGEDIEGICSDMQPLVKAKLIPVVAGGFRGNSYDGINIGLDMLLPLIEKHDNKVKNSVNLIVPQANLNPTWWADLKWIKEILKSLGIEVISVIPYNTSQCDLKNAGRASANILLSHDVGHTFAKKFQEKFNVPLILDDIPLPIGLQNTARWIRELRKYFDVEENKIEEIIAEGEELVIDILRRRGLMIIPRYRNCKIAISGDATIGIGLIRMLFEELEMIPDLIMLRSDSVQARNLLERELASLSISPKVVFNIDGYQIKRALKEVDVDAIIGSAWEKYIAEEIGIKLTFDVLNPTNKDIYMDKQYFGYIGMLNILEVIANDWETAFRSKQINWEQY